MKYSLYDASVIDLIKSERFEVQALDERISSVSKEAKEQILAILAQSNDQRAHDLLKKIRIS